MIHRSRLTLAIFLNALSAPSFAKDFDLVMKNSRGIETETSFDAIRNVGILDGRVAAISKRDIRTYVLVNGVVVLRDSEFVEGVYPGQPIRYRVEKQGRWVPLKKKNYLKNLLKSDLPFNNGITGQR